MKILGILGALLGVVGLAVAMFFYVEDGIVYEAPAPIEVVEEIIEEIIPERETADIVLATTTIPDKDNNPVEILIDEDFELIVAADNLGKARFMSMSPDGRMFVPDLVNYKLSHEGRILILEDFNEETKQFETTNTYLSNLRGVNSLAFYTDEEGQTWLYVALTKELVRYKYSDGDMEPQGEPEFVTDFPNKQSPGEVSVVWHITRTMHFVDDTIYIAIGSGCNSCEELEGGMRAAVVSVKADGSDKKIYAEGLRNSVGIEWANDALYVTANGEDHLGTDRPDERMFKLSEGEHYGWPYCYEWNGEIYPETSQQWNNDFDCATEGQFSLAAFEPRSAPLGLTYFGEDSHDKLYETFLVALHGSFDPKVGAGYEVVRVNELGEKQTFMDGLLSEEGERLLRPVDFLQYDENSFFMTDDWLGRVYFVTTKN